MDKSNTKNSVNYKFDAQYFFRLDQNIAIVPNINKNNIRTTYKKQWELNVNEDIVSSNEMFVYKGINHFINQIDLGQNEELLYTVWFISNGIKSGKENDIGSKKNETWFMKPQKKSKTFFTQKRECQNNN